jgi:hypothetical protein
MSIESDDVSVVIKFSCRAMSDALQRREYDRFLVLESAFYNQVVKVTETATHYELCYSELDPIGRAYGDVLRGVIPKVSHGSPARRVCYLLPNIDNDLAHIEFLYHILKHHPPKSDLQITVAGYAQDASPCASRFLSRLASEGRISLAKIPDSHAGRIQFARFFLNECFSQLIVYSIPLQLSGWVRALGPGLVTWATTKFELAAFEELRNRVSFSGVNGPVGMSDPESPKSWHRSSNAISRESIIPYDPARRRGNKLVTVNRAEKIRTPEFLEAVSSILISEPSATFAWTGRSRDPVIQGFFDAAGVAPRCEFIGWVDPATTLGKYDVFLDTFGLSGVVATQAFCSGMPAVFFKDSRAWVEIHEYGLDESPSLLSDRVLAGSVDVYVKAVLELIRDQELYLARSASQRKFAERFFFDETAMYTSHIQILRRLVGAIGNPPTGMGDYPGA